MAEVQKTNYHVSKIRQEYLYKKLICVVLLLKQYPDEIITKNWIIVNLLKVKVKLF